MSLGCSPLRGEVYLIKFSGDPLSEQVGSLFDFYGVGGAFSLVEALVLPKLGSDHFPLVLQGGATRLGPRPFRFQLMWLLHPRFLDLVACWWRSFVVEEPSG